MSPYAFSQLSDAEKFEYLYRHGHATETALQRLAAGMELLHDRLKKLEEAVAETVE
jgi:hypothetical protein